MKCIHCGTDSKLKDRQSNGGRCTGCSHRFAFEPTTDPRKVTDGLFQRCIKDVSGDGTLFFTEKQLWYELNRQLQRKLTQIPAPFAIGATACAMGGAAGILAGTAILLPIGLLAGIGTLVVGTVVGKRNVKPKPVTVPLEEFKNLYLGPYRGTHGVIEKLLPDIKTAPITQNRSPVSGVPPDLTSYSFDRALITEDADTAAMLVANRFHFENNCAILSLDRRYPEAGRFEMIFEMLRNNPNLTVFGIHDASIDGLRLPLTLRAENWFPDRSIRIVDLGLRPLHVLKSAFLLTTRRIFAVPPEIAVHLGPEELKWLEKGLVAEIASLRPARLMRAIYQGFNQVNTMPYDQTGADGGILVVGGPGHGGVWAGDGMGGNVYAPDSFG